MRLSSRLAFSLLALPVTSACGGGLSGGSKWMEEPLSAEEHTTDANPSGERAKQMRPRTIGAIAPPDDRTGGGGKILGTFRNTYYDFPREAASSPSSGKADSVALMSASCVAIARVPKAFHDAVCVQGSGALAKGGTVSFAKRDCACAETCPRTGQKICFEALDAVAFPFGRGATGRPITPMKTVAADTAILPMGTVLYIPELDGEGSDGCFIVEDRGLKVKGEHVDIFTGDAAETQRINERVPSNQGVTVVLSAPRCSHLARR